MRPQTDIQADIQSLIDRLGRIVTAEGWGGDLNPAQTAALSYLARANRFSRSPSVVSEYLGTTRGTVSQTLKALHRKGLVTERANPNDKRSISYEITEAGQAIVGQTQLLNDALKAIPVEEHAVLMEQLQQIVVAALTVRGNRTFGACKTCKNHISAGDNKHCALLDVPLLEHEADQICVEQISI